MSNKNLNLKSNDVNLSQKSKIGCHFSNGFKKVIGNKTFTHKDKEGIMLIILIIIFSVLIVYKKYKLSVIIFLFIINFIYSDPLRIIYPFSYLISLKTKNYPYLNRKKVFPSYIDFENTSNFKKIKKEVVNYLENYDKAFIDTRDSFDSETNRYIGGGDKSVGKNWKISTILIGNKFSKLAKKKLPYLVRLLKKNSNIVSCAISLLPAKKAIPIHVGYFKGVLRYQLAITVPKDRKNVFICVNGEKYSWKEGEGVLFDDMYPHKVYNNTDEKRVVLYMDVKRPLNNCFYNSIINFIVKLISGTNISKNELKRTEYLVKL